jgi:hypothetical protein
MRTLILAMTAALAVGAGTAVLANSLGFAPILLAALVAWVIVSFLQWRQAWRLRFAPPQTRSNPRKEK